jgi:Mrp family chromosome partitioning ATPase
MTNTDQAFIRAYRRDAARAATQAPIAARTARQPSVLPAAFRTSVEFVGAEYPTSSAALRSIPIDEAVLPDDAVAIVGALPPLASSIKVPSKLAPTKKKNPSNIPREGSIGRRPLSSFVNRAAADHATSDRSSADQSPAAPSHADPEFAPQTNIAAFRWPSVCRAAWQRSAAEYQRVAELVLRQSAAEKRLVGIAGLRPGDGCTTTLLCLAAAVAGPDRRVILLDANFRSPQLAAQLGVAPDTGWQDVLARGLGVEEAVIRAQGDRVDLLPLDVRNVDGPQLAAGLQPSITAGVLRYAYDVVLLDLGAILAPSSFATTVHLLRNMSIDSALLVADRRRSDQSDLTMASELLKENGCQPLGIIENRAA